MNELLERYQQGELVSESEFCQVYRGRDRAGEAEVALKLARTPLGLRMLESELLACAELKAQHGLRRVVQPQGFLAADPPFLVMPWLPGGSLRQLMRSRAPADAQLLEVFFACLRTVRRVHQVPLAHGDLKPANILLDHALRPWLTDFGLARVIQDHRLQSRLDHSLGSGQQLAGGTLAYMAPELIKGGPPSLAGDVYALGVILHELLLGTRPDSAVLPEQLTRRVEPAVLDVLRRALAFHPADRFADASAMLAALLPQEMALTARGLERVGRGLSRFGRRLAASFFIFLRYSAVLLLLVGYLAIAIAGVVETPLLFLLFIPVLILHLVIRWEGIESPAEATARSGRGWYS